MTNPREESGTPPGLRETGDRETQQAEISRRGRELIEQHVRETDQHVQLIMPHNIRKLEKYLIHPLVTDQEKKEINAMLSNPETLADDAGKLTSRLYFGTKKRWYEMERNNPDPIPGGLRQKFSMLLRNGFFSVEERKAGSDFLGWPGSTAAEAVGKFEEARQLLERKKRDAEKDLSEVFDVVLQELRESDSIVCRDCPKEFIGHPDLLSCSDWCSEIKDGKKLWRCGPCELAFFQQGERVITEAEYPALKEKAGVLVCEYCQRMAYVGLGDSSPRKSEHGTVNYDAQDAGWRLTNPNTRSLERRLACPRCVEELNLPVILQMKL